MTNFKEVKISEIFDILWEQSKLTKTFMQDNKGDFPVYSWETKNTKAYWYISSYKFDGKLLIWTTYWDAWNLKIKEWKFNIWRNASWLRTKGKYMEYIYLEYIKCVSQIYFKLNAQWDKWVLRKLPQKRVKDIRVKIPIDEKWEFDLEKQKEIAEKYEKLEKMKDRIRIMKEDIEDKQIIFTKNLNLRTVNVSDVLISPPTNSWLKKVHVSIDEKEWYLPVYSASKNENAVFGWLNENTDWKKYENVLTWNKDGSSWVVFYRENTFIPYEKVKILEIKESYKSNLDYNFLRKIIENKLLSFWYSFWVKCSMDNVLKTEIKIPIKENGEFDLGKQKEIAEKYWKIEKIKNNLIQELEYLEKVKVEI